jgi:hypothetical protein
MNINPSTHPLYTEVHRDVYIKIIETALRMGEHRFARKAALAWLRVFPGDLGVALLQAQAFHAANGNPSTTAAILRHLILKDPLFLKAYQMGSALAQETDQAAYRFFVDGLFAVSGDKQNKTISKWSQDLYEARINLQNQNFTEAEVYLLAALTEDPANPLVAVTHLELLLASDGGRETAYSLINRRIIEHYFQRWENCLQVRLIQGDALLSSGQTEKGVSLLHSVIAEDTQGQVITRLWGKNHPYRNLWPDSLSIPLTVPLPASIAAIYGLNLLERGADNLQNLSSGVSESIEKFRVNKYPAIEAGSEELSDWSKKSILPEILISTQKTLETVAEKINHPELIQSDGRFPIYLILSTSQGLAKKYGADGFEVIHNQILRLVKAVNDRRSWRAEYIDIDNPKIITPMGLKPVLNTDPWAIKRTLTDYDQILARKGEMIGALLIVGGTDVIPFHRLPNPVDDQDTEIPSDNPYGTRDENYFVQEWPVGRLPGDSTSNATILFNELEIVIQNHIQSEIRRTWAQRILDKLRKYVRRMYTVEPQNIGYTAAIWKGSAEAVFQTLSETKNLYISPPYTSREYKKQTRPIRNAYFNLHGILGSPDWFGHNDPTKPKAGPDYPVVMQPQDIRGGDLSPQVIFSEACYGAMIEDKSISESICLKFLSQGAGAFIGSTRTAYGSVTTPLIAADYLAQTFWKYIRKGIVVGEALRRAKIDLINEMDKRQGYLDGEDQKTILSFILYGDPLLNPYGKRHLPKEVLRPLEKTEVQTVCDKQDQETQPEIPAEVIRVVKKAVHHYLPGMDGAEISVNPIHKGCQGGEHKCPSSQLNHQQKVQNTSERRVIVMSKHITLPGQSHYQYARLTVNHNGKIIKMSVSR